jgi:hypothetical protein
MCAAVCAPETFTTLKPAASTMMAWMARPMDGRYRISPLLRSFLRVVLFLRCCSLS